MIVTPEARGPHPPLSAQGFLGEHKLQLVFQISPEFLAGDPADLQMRVHRQQVPQVGFGDIRWRDGHAKAEAIGKSDVGFGDLSHRVGDEIVGRALQNVVTHHQGFGLPHRLGHAFAVWRQRPVHQGLHLRIFAIAACQDWDEPKFMAGDATAGVEKEVQPAEERSE